MIKRISKVQSVILLLFISFVCYADDLIEISIPIDSNPRTLLYILDSRIEVHFLNNPFNETPTIITWEGNVSLSTGLLFFDFYYPGGVFIGKGQMIEKLEDGNQKWLILYNHDIRHYSIYSDDRDKPIYDYGMEYTIHYRQFLTYTATSHLTENGIEYSPENLKDNRTGRPWVEGVPGDGVGEKIFLTYERYPSEGFSHLLLSNGFVSYGNPSLYGKNGRLKRIRVEDRESEFFQEFAIEDTPNYQILELDRPLKTITVEILEVYPGSRWEDTCVNLLEPVWPQL